MKYVYIKESFEGVSKKTQIKQTYYVIKLALCDNDVIIAKSQPILWLTKEQFDNIK